MGRGGRICPSEGGVTNGHYHQRLQMVGVDFVHYLVATLFIASGSAY